MQYHFYGLNGILESTKMQLTKTQSARMQSAKRLARFCAISAGVLMLVSSALWADTRERERE